MNFPSQNSRFQNPLAHDAQANKVAIGEASTGSVALDKFESDILAQLSAHLEDVGALLASLHQHREQSSLMLSQRRFCQESGYSYGAVKEQMHLAIHGKDPGNKVLIEGIHFERAESGRFVFRYKASCDAMASATKPARKTRSTVAARYASR